MKHYLLTYIDERGYVRLATINADNARYARIDASRLVRAVRGRFIRLTETAI